MTQDLTTLPLEEFFRLAVQRGGLDLEEVAHGLSPEAAEALRMIAASAAPAGAAKDLPLRAPTRGAVRAAPLDWASRSPAGEQARPEPSPAARRSPARDYLRKLGDRFRRRGQPSGSPAAGLTLDDLVEEGRLTPVQAQELRETLVLHQSNYPAGTRYSVFG